MRAGTSIGTSSAGIVVIFLCLHWTNGQAGSCSKYCPYLRHCYYQTEACQKLYLYCRCSWLKYSLTVISSTSVTVTNTSGNNDCGVSAVTGETRSYLGSHRIIGGQGSMECEFPWQALVRSRTGMCGGTVIDDLHVLTAAHCVVTRNRAVHPASLRIGLGSSRRTRTKTYFAAKIDVHPRYRRNRLSEDVAVVTLKERLRWTRCIRPICLPEPGDRVDVGETCVVSGWGNTAESGSSVQDVLRSVEVTVVNQSSCRRVFGSRLIARKQICAGNMSEGGQDACRGDSGGPLMCGARNRRKIMGIVSFGRGCGRRGVPGVYTFVPAYLDWINSVL